MWRFNWKFVITTVMVGFVIGGLALILIFSTNLREHARFIMYLSYSLLFALSLGIIACAAYIIITSTGKVKVATHEEHKRALSFKAAHDKAVLYLMRPQFLGFARAFPVYIDDKELWLKGKMFYYLTLPAGTYTLSGNKACQNELILDLKGAEIYFVEQQIMVSMFRTGYQHVVIEDTEKGAQGVMSCKKMLTLPDSK